MQNNEDREYYFQSFEEEKLDQIFLEEDIEVIEWGSSLTSIENGKIKEIIDSGEVVETLTMDGKEVRDLHLDESIFDGMKLEEAEKVLFFDKSDHIAKCVRDAEYRCAKELVSYKYDKMKEAINLLSELISQ